MKPLVLTVEQRKELERRRDARKHRSSRLPVDDQGLGRSADTDAPELGVTHHACRHVGVGRTVDIGVADTFEVAEHRDSGVARHAFDQ